MTNEELLQEILSLPVDAQRKVEEYVDYLHRLGSSKTNSETSFEDEEFFGIWSDRDEIKDSTAWVRKIRESHWSK